MKVSEGWLRAWANPAADSEALEKQFSMAGLEVDGVEGAAPAFSGVVVEVTAVAPHPDADKLKVCTVADGRGTQQVVCGAPNVTVGMKAPYAQVGAVLPEGFKIKKAKLRGVESAGMLCGPDELGLSEERYGLMELPASLQTGADFREALDLNDEFFEIDLTPNQGDCLSVRGLARELAVLNRVDFCAEPSVLRWPPPLTIPSRDRHGAGRLSSLPGPNHQGRGRLPPHTRLDGGAAPSLGFEKHRPRGGYQLRNA